MLKNYTRAFNKTSLIKLYNARFFLIITLQGLIQCSTFMMKTQHKHTKVNSNGNMKTDTFTNVNFSNFHKIPSTYNIL